MTDSAGLYRLAQLPPGVYTIKLEKESFRPFSRAEITLRVDRTIRVNIQLQPESVTGDVVDINGQPPVVDVGSTNTGINVGKEFINNIAFITPNGNGVKSFESLASVAPQVGADEYGYGFSGAQSPENLYLVDGVSTSDPAFGTNGAQFPVEFVEEANVITGGYQAEYGRATGGVLNVVTKSGSNEFHGSVWGDWTPGALSGVSPAINNDASVFVNQQRLWNTVDFGADVGGPIIKDRLWFYVGFSPAFNRLQDTRILRRFLLTDDKKNYVFGADGYIASETIPGTTQTRFDDVRSFSYIAKLTFLINSDNNLSASVIGSPTTTTIPFAFNKTNNIVVKPWNGGTVDQNDTTTVSLRYQGGFLDKHLLVDASLGWFHIAAGTAPNDGSQIGAKEGLSATGAPAVTFRRTIPHSILDFESIPDPSLCEPAGTRNTARVDVRGQQRYLMACPATGGGQTYTIGGMGFVGYNVLDRIQGRASITYLMQALGHHIWKVGLDIERLSYDIKKSYSGGVFLRESTAGTSFADYRQYGYFTGPDTAVTQPFVHSIPTSTGIGAYIQDSWSILDVVTLNAGLRYETQQLFSADGSLGMTLNNELSPRIGLIYDFTQQGRSKLFASYSRFYEAMPIDIADRALTGENQYSFSRLKAAGAQNGNLGCDPLKSFSQVFTECKDPNNYRALQGEPDVNRAGFQTGAGKTPVDPNIVPQSSDEIIVGGEYEIITDGRIGATYTKRWVNRVVEDMSLDEANSYFLSNPGYGLGSAFPKAVRDYDAVTASFTKAFSDGWMGQVSYTWSYLRGNYAGLFRPESGQLDPNINSDFDLISLLQNRTGPLPGNTTHFIKAYASKEFLITGSFGIVVGLTYTGRSGSPISYLGSHVLYGAGESYMLPRGSGGETPWVHAINAKVGFSYRLNKDSQIQITADLFNLFNFQAVTAVDNTLTSTDVLPFVPNPSSNLSPQAQACIGGSANAACKAGVTTFLHGDGTPLASSELNSNYKRPLAYQAPISVRFGVRFTF